MDRRIPLWVALSICAAVLIGCGIFFALQDLGTANDYATIASFFLALVTAAGSLLSFVRSKQESEPPDPEAGQGQHFDGGMTFNNGIIYSNQTGAGSFAEVTIDNSAEGTKVTTRRNRRR